MSSPKKKYSESANYTAYTNAYLNTVDWQLVFPGKPSKFLMWVSDSANSRPEFVISSLMNVVSTLLGPKTTVESDNGQKLKPNIYLFALGLPGTGKSPAYEKFVSDPLTKIERDSNMNILHKAFTPAGLLSALAQNEGYGLVCGDEICHAISPMFTSYKDDSLELRHNLNNLFSGGGYSKTFKGGSKKLVKFPSSYFVLGGTSQPDPFLAMMAKITAVKDGLEDRIMVLCANPRRKFAALDGGVSVANDFWMLSENWIHSLCSLVFAAHRAEMAYQFEPEAMAFLKEWRNTASEHYDDQISEFEVLLKNKVATISDVPTVPNDTKDVDYIQKFAVLIHVCRHYLSIQQENGIQNVVPAPVQVIPIAVVKAAAHMVSKMRQQLDALCSVVRANEDSSEAAGSSAAFDIITSDTTDIVAMISLFPGKIVASRLLQRKNRSLKNPPKATPIMECMLACSKAADELQFFGQHYRQQKTQLFCKAAWEKCDNAFLESHGVTEASYKAAFDADVTHCPVTGVGFASEDDWRQKYSEWVQHAPQEVKATWPDTAIDN